MADDDPLDDLELLPAEDEGLEPADDLAAAEASAVEDEPPEAQAEPIEPLGRTWLFDRMLGRFVRDGLAPREVYGRDSLAVWCETAMDTAQFAHPIFPPEFGMERPESPIGEAADAIEEMSDWAARVEDALTVHDRVTAVENFNGHYHEDEGVLYIHSLDVLTDEEDDASSVRLGGLSVDTVVD